MWRTVERDQRSLVVPARQAGCGRAHRAVEAELQGLLLLRSSEDGRRRIQNYRIYLSLPGTILKGRRAKSWVCMSNFQHTRMLARSPWRPRGAEGHLGLWLFLSVHGIVSGHFPFVSENLSCWFWGSVMLFTEISENRVYSDL